MKKAFLVNIFLLMIFIVIENVSADCSIKIGSAISGDGKTGSERIILEVSDLTNAHGKQFTSSSTKISTKYYVVCPTTDIGNNPTGYTCDADNKNKILGLANPLNAHAEIPGGNSYSTKICYSGITGCKPFALGKNANCPEAGYFGVASLSSLTNAHIGPFLGDDAYNYGLGSTNVKICCTIQTCINDAGCDASHLSNIRNKQCSSDKLQYDKCEQQGVCYKWKTIVESCPDPTTKCDATAGAADCRSYCGNGVFEDTTGEECDDGNDISGDGCENDSSSNGCVASAIILTCHDYCGDGGCDTNSKKNACTNDIEGVANNGFNNCNVAGIDPASRCPTITNCGCIFDSSDNKCKAKKTTIGTDSSCNTIESGSCTLTSTSSSSSCLTNEFISIDWTGSITWGTNEFANAKCKTKLTDSSEPDRSAWCVKDGNVWRYDPEDLTNTCKSGSNLIQCPSKVKLTFFNWITFTSTLILLVLIYLIWNIFYKKKKRKKK